MLTTSQKGRNNVMTMCWYTMMEFEPPLVGCVVSNRNYTFNKLKTTRECVIAIPTLGMAHQVVRAGNISGRKTDKFKKLELATIPATQVKAPLLAGCYVNLECRVVDSTMVNKYNFFILEVVRAWINPSTKNPKTLHHRSYGFFMVPGKTIRFHSKKK